MKRGMFFKMVSLLSLLTLASPAFGHGEQNPGPHKGYIRMPGAFHTEIVPSGPSEFKLYLLDVTFNNPMTKNSSVAVILQNGNQKLSVPCSPAKEYFACSLPQGLTLDSGVLEVTAKRLGAAGVPIQYKLPLSFSSY